MTTKRRYVKSRDVVDAHERNKDFLTEGEAAKFLAAAKKSRYGIRDHLIILMLYRHGLRVSELTSMKRWAAENCRFLRFGSPGRTGRSNSQVPEKTGEIYTVTHSNVAAPGCESKAFLQAFCAYQASKDAHSHSSEIEHGDYLATGQAARYRAGNGYDFGS